MVKLWKPMFSDSATGIFARTIAYRDGATRAIGCRPPHPSKSRSLLQDSQRTKFLAGCTAWRALTPIERANWQSSAPPGQTGFNYFLSDFLL